MSSVVQVAIHPSQFPDAVRRDLQHSLQTHQLNHKFLYDGYKQARKWLALHVIYSPSRTDADCRLAYFQSFTATVRQSIAKSLHVIGFGCGGGQKDAHLLHLLKAAGKTLAYTPCDVSTAMVLVAHDRIASLLPKEACHPLVCDLASADDLPAVFEEHSVPGAARLITFFGMIPNFEPEVIMPRLTSLLRPGDQLLFSANLAPGPDYASGLRQILPQYDNAPTRDWLMTFLHDLGVEQDDGELVFSVEEDPAGGGLQRVVANFHFQRLRQVQADRDSEDFIPGSSFRLFFSYRYTPDRVRGLLSRHGLAVLDQWITKSQEEGVFLCQKNRLEP